MSTNPSARPCVLLVNLGTPVAPTSSAVRTYLREFLSDRRVVETHPLLWKPILEGIILRIRPRQSAKKYAQVWTDLGSPLKVNTEKQVEMLQEHLGNSAEVRFAMRYGDNSISDTLDDLYAQGCRKILTIPAYPQYSATTVASVNDEIHRWALRSRDQFEWRIGRSYPDHPSYIKALATAITQYWEEHGRPRFDRGDRLILSYHGIPVSMHRAGDPYPSECELTTASLTRALNLPKGGILHAYQSVFGPQEWLTPATIETVKDLGTKGAHRVDVICPGFTADCLETLEEINIQNRKEFTSNGGKEFHYIPWANDNEAWVDALAELARIHLSRW